MTTHKKRACLAAAVATVMVGALLSPAPAAADRKRALRLKALQRGCEAPKGLELGRLDRVRRRPKPDAFMPIALDRGDDLAGCKAKLRRREACRMGSIVVVDVGRMIKRAGRCSRDPEGTKAYAVGSGLNLGFALPQRLPGFKDEYQTFVFWTNFKQTSNPNVPVGKTQGCPLAWHSEISRGRTVSVRGVGLRYAPSNSQLHAIINIWSIKDWKDDELFYGEDVEPLNILAHETEHDICCSVGFRDPKDGTISKALIGQQGAHWSLYHNTFGQLMYGANWREEGNGTFYSIPPARGTRPLDLYLWGLIPPQQVPPIYLVDTKGKNCKAKKQTLDAIATDCAEMTIPQTTLKCKDDFNKCLTAFDLCIDPPYYRTIDGKCDPYSSTTLQTPQYLRAEATKRVVKIEDIIAANGSRFPDYKNSYKINTQLFVLLVESADALEQKTIDRLNKFRRLFSRHLYQVTGYRMRNRNSWQGKVDSPLWEWGGVPQWSGDSELEGWEGVALKTGKPLLKGGGLELALMGGTSGITHNNLQLEAKDYDAFQVVMRAPAIKDAATGKPKLLSGTFVFEDQDGKKSELSFPLPADAKLHKITVHPRHALMKKGKCSGCVAVCRFSDKPEEGYYDSCTDTLLRKGKCKSDAGQTVCGPYCFNQGTEDEGWVDSCKSELTGTFTKLTVIPIAGDDAKKAGKVWIDRVDLFKVEDVVKNEKERKHGEKDDDGDGLINAFDNCPTVRNPLQLDGNEDKKGDACDDNDADGVENALDNCPTTVNSLQQDEDEDGLGDACDPDFDASSCSIDSKADPSSLSLLLLLLLLLWSRRRT